MVGGAIPQLRDDQDAPAESGISRIVVVGYDASEAAAAALAWAAWYSRSVTASVLAVAVQENSGGAVRHTEQHPSVGGLPPEDVRVEVLSGPTGQALVQAASGAQALVLGAAKRVGALGAGAGSVTQYCLRHINCPVIIAPPSGPPAVRRVIVSRTLDPAVSSFGWAVGFAHGVGASVHLLDADESETAIPRDALDSKLSTSALGLHRSTWQQLQAQYPEASISHTLARGTVRDMLQSRVRPGDLVVMPPGSAHHLAFIYRRCAAVVLPQSSPSLPSLTPAPLASYSATADRADAGRSAQRLRPG